jgi:hypothetical protein
MLSTNRQAKAEEFQSDIRARIAAATEQARRRRKKPLETLAPKH